MRDKFLKAAIVALALAGTILLLFPVEWFPGFYAPRFMGVAAFFFIIVIISPQWILRPATPTQQESTRRLQYALIWSLLLSGLGEMGLWQLYKYGFEYDKVVHVLMPFLVTTAAIPAIHDRYTISWDKSIWVSFALAILVGILWEYAEFYNDRIFGTLLFGIYGADVYRDTALDLAGNLAGTALAVLIAFRRRT